MTATISGTSGGIGLIGSGTAQNSTSGTEINFTGIPAGVKRITVMFNNVSTNGSSNPQVQIGSGSYTTSGYLGSASNMATAVSSASFTSGFGVFPGMAAFVVFQSTLVIVNVSGNTWVASGVGGSSDQPRTFVSGGSVVLGGALDRLRITTVNGTDTFDAGSINILYE